MFFLFALFFLVKLALSTKHGLVEITAGNYQSLVIDGEKDAWIVAIKGAGKVSMDEWRKTELNLRGLSVRVGIIDPNTDGAFLKRKVGVAVNSSRRVQDSCIRDFVRKSISFQLYLLCNFLYEVALEP